MTEKMGSVSVPKAIDMRIYNHVVGLEESDPERLMKDAGLDFRLGFGGIGVDDDFNPLVFDKCGGYGNLDRSVYRVRIDLLP